MTTTQPTPQPPNPTTESEDTPPTTNQHTQEPVGPLITDSTNGIQATDSEGATGTELRIPTTSETATDLPSILSSQTQSGPPNTGLIIGIVIIIVIVSVLVITVVVVIAILLMIKKRHVKFTAIAIPTAANQAYGQNTHKGVEESIRFYNFSGPEVAADNIIEAKQNVAYVTNTEFIVEVNEAYATRIAIKGNEAYATNITTEGNQEYATNITTEENQAYATNDIVTTGENQAYATSIVAEGNQAYATNVTMEENQAYSTSIATEKDAAYEPVTTSETADVYEVVNCSI